MASLRSMAGTILAEIERVFDKAESGRSHPVDVIVREILACKGGRIVVYGVGREGLMMKAMAMRLYHLGLRAHCVGDMAAPPVGSGDLMVVSAGPGGFSTVDALCSVARDAGARILLITAQPDGSSSRLAHAIAVLPAQTMADDLTPSPSLVSLLPMGSLFEGALFVLSEMVVLKLFDLLGETPHSMRDRHTNLE